MFIAVLPRLRNISRAVSRHQRRSLASASMRPGQPFEEERLPWYTPDQFYPVRIGEVLDSKYKVVGKLGYGAYSTAWLCRSIRDTGFVSIKVCTRDGGPSTRLRRELQFYEHVASLKSQHPGQSFIRGLFGTFEIAGPAGQHLCLVHPPMHMTIQELQYSNPSHRLNEQLLKWTLSNLLSALSFLHDEARVVHTDLNASNIMLTLEDESLLHDFETAEADEPSPTKVIDNTRTIYGSRKLGLPKGSLWGQPVLCDFGQARIGESHRGLIQPELYRAPEVLFDMEWNSSADIWNVAVLIWDLFENRHLFNALDENSQSSATHHVAEMVGYLGLPPRKYLQRSEITKNVFDQGRWKGAGGVAIPQVSLQESVAALDGEAKEEFLAFIRSMLDWLPEKRKRASELLEDPWMARITPLNLNEKHGHDS
ncbi:Serine/threonine-protein kinase SRPK [Tolypocladium ophioglossoides CBS 100239]|uniref:non-specific serine/threonine protein kinase n=1 Tax=Tolypocladium ophioglossoides (strain CBS 100239) TaxID=1163406 RepID=A0A0L0N582_TOLOC|nr:Serine/threonine-protein kinase SRPK [Tolypocladium ophioglossoides CBS 100239]